VAQQLPRLVIAPGKDATMRYATRLAAPDPFILLDDGKKRHVLVSVLEYGLAKRTLSKSKRHVVVLFEPYYDKVKKELAKRGEKGKIRRRHVLALIAAKYLREKKIRKVVMPPSAWAAHVATLRENGIRVELGTKRFYPERDIKTVKELKEINAVGRATVAALDCCMEILRSSRPNAKGELVHRGAKVTSESLKRAARHVLLERDCEAPELILSHGLQTRFPHELGAGAIKEGEPVLFDFFCRSTESGYWFDLSRTVVIGKPSREYLALWRAVKEAQDAALDKIRPGVRCGAVNAEIEDVFKKRGFATTDEEGFLHGAGHGVGLEIHESPTIGKGSADVLKAGMVVTVEPGLYYKKLGGARLENTILVTRDGSKDLTRYPRRMAP